MDQFTFLNYLSIVSFFTTFVLSLYILFANFKAEANRTLSFFIFLSGVWVFTNFMVDIAPNVQLALFWVKLTIVAPIFMPPFLLHFSEIYPKVHSIKRGVVWRLVTLLPSVGLITLVPGKANIEQIFYVPGQIPQVEVGFLYTLLFVYFVCYFAWVFWNFWRSYVETSGRYREQVRFVSIGLFCTIASAVVTNLVLPILGNSLYSGIGTASSLIFIGFTTYAIARHRLMDIRLAIRAFILKVLLGAVIAGGAYVISRPFTLDLVETTEVNIGIAVTLAAFTVVFIYGPLDRFLRRITDAVLFQREYNRQELLNRLGRDLSESINLKELQGRIRYTIKEAMRVQRVSFQLKDHSTDILWKQVRVAAEMIVFDELVRELEETESGTRRGQQEKVVARMRELDVAVVLPLPVTDNVIGMILLSGKQGGDAFTSQDLDALETLRFQAGVAIENALLYQQVKDFNVELQKKVEQATKELSVKNKQLLETNAHLQELDQLKTDLVGLASHELKTPMTVIMTHLWMALNREEEEVGREEYMKYLQRAYESSQRMIALIEDMLSVSRLEGGQVNLKLEKLDIAKVVGGMVDELKIKAQERGLQLEMLPPSGPLPKALIDKNRFIEIITNLVGNAVKYTDQGQIKVEIMANTERAPERVLKLEQDPVPDGTGQGREGAELSSALSEAVGKFVWVTVTDTGRGIVPEDMPRLFQKFGKLEQGDYVKSAETGGTGLGLYITKGLVELHGGSIWVESPPSQALWGAREKDKAPVPDGTGPGTRQYLAGHGSTFGFSVRAAT